MAIGRQVARPLQPDADLGAVVAAQHGPVLDQRHAQPQPGGGDRRAGPRDAAAHDHQIVRSRRLPAFRAGPAACGGTAASCGSWFGGARFGLGGQEDRVAAALETGQVVQRQGRLPAGNLHPAAVLPMPVGPLRAEDRGQGLAVDEHLELARASPAPSRGPPNRACAPSTRYVPGCGKSPPWCGRRPPAGPVHAPAGRGSPSRPSTADPRPSRPGGRTTRLRRARFPPGPTPAGRATTSSQSRSAWKSPPRLTLLTSASRIASWRMGMGVRPRLAGDSRSRDRTLLVAGPPPGTEGTQARGAHRAAAPIPSVLQHHNAGHDHQKPGAEIEAAADEKHQQLKRIRKVCEHGHPFSLRFREPFTTVGLDLSITVRQATSRGERQRGTMP